jgi:hypothetical protein
MSYTTPDYVYDKIGVDIDSISSAQMTRILSEADAEVDRIIGTTCDPKTKIELFDGDNNNYLYLKYIPLMQISSLEIDDTAITISKVKKYNYGQIVLLSSAEQAYFYRNTSGQPNVRIKYTYGWLKETTTQDETQSANVAGTSQTVSVSDGSQFTTNDYVRIVGFDGYDEITKITNVSSNDLTCTLTVPHETGSQVTKLEVPQEVRLLAGVVAAIMGALYMVGSTYTFATSYQTPDYSVTKGVPYPHFNTNMQAWVRERDFLMKQIPKWPVVE